MSHFVHSSRLVALRHILASSHKGEVMRSLKILIITSNCLLALVPLWQVLLEADQNFQVYHKCWQAFFMLF